MKLQILGSGSMGSSYFNASSIVNNELLVDMPNGILKYMKKINLDITNIRYVFITHLHGDHFADIPFYIFYKYNNKLNFETVIYGPKGMCEVVKVVFNAMFPDLFETIIDKTNIRFIEHDGIENLELSDGLKINSKLVDHGNLKPAYGYIVSDGNNSIGFSGDSILTDSIEEIASSCDLSVLDASVPYEGNPSHMGLNDIEYLCKKYNDKKIICTHMGDGARDRAINLDIKNMIVPEDGKIINI